MVRVAADVFLTSRAQGVLDNLLKGAATQCLQVSHDTFTSHAYRATG